LINGWEEGSVVAGHLLLKIKSKERYIIKVYSNEKVKMENG
jgi:hypothetical protein